MGLVCKASLSLECNPITGEQSSCTWNRVHPSGTSSRFRGEERQQRDLVAESESSLRELTGP
jgi:hypothetical protein